MIDIVSKRRYAYAFSLVITAAAILSVATWGLKFGIDFSGGTLMEVRFPSGVPQNTEISEVLQGENLQSLTIQASGDGSALLRYASEDDAVNEKAWQAISAKWTDAVRLRVDFINSTVSGELKRNSLLAIFWAVAAIMAYIAWAFRKVSRPVPSWQYGALAVVALVHDILITVGAFAALGHFYSVEVGIPFVAALLTILGFSVHDTIVVYDRTRENLLRSPEKTFAATVNRSLNETIVRSINTSLTVIITLLAIYLFGGESIRDFSLALLIGITFGTYSSIFIASSLLVTSRDWMAKKHNK
ncbi:MAG TPA: protein translocase subunit SecF [Candidatus Moranbacteria bacterium]|nr:protein translocase subunit SecF [Candidatus Moranbacteria bacterium]